MILLNYLKLKQFNAIVRRCYQTENNKVRLKDLNFYQNLFETKYEPTRNFLLQNVHLLNIDKEELIESLNTLKSLNYTIGEVRKSANLLLLNERTIRNRHMILLECGFKQVSAEILNAYIRTMNRRIGLLKSYNYIPIDYDVVNGMEKQLNEYHSFKIAENTIDLNGSLKDVRLSILSAFLMNKFNLTTTEITNCFKSYAQLRHKAIESIIRTLQILENDLKFTDDKIKRNLFVLYADPDSIKNMLLHVPTLAGLDIREIFYERPKILQANYVSLIEIENHLRTFNIPNNCVWNSLDLFTLNSDTVLTRLKELTKVKEFSVLAKHPRMLRLVLYQTKAKVRLEYLKQLKIKCFTLNLLASPEQHFIKFAREGSEKTYGNDVTAYLSIYFKKPEIIIRKYLLRHPHWLFVPALSVKKSLDYLKREHFTIDELYQNIYVIFYPLNKIIKTLKSISTLEPSQLMFMHLPASYKLSNSKRLAVCLYFMEAEYHFTGDGVWADSSNTNNSQNELISSSSIPLPPKSGTIHFSYGRRKHQNIEENVI